MKKEAASVFVCLCFRLDGITVILFRQEEDADPVRGIQRVRDDGTCFHSKFLGRVYHMKKTMRLFSRKLRILQARGGGTA